MDRTTIKEVPKEAKELQLKVHSLSLYSQLAQAQIRKSNQALSQKHSWVVQLQLNQWLKFLSRFIKCNHNSNYNNLTSGSLAMTKKVGLGCRKSNANPWPPLGLKEANKKRASAGFESTPHSRWLPSPGHQLGFEECWVGTGTTIQNRYGGQTQGGGRRLHFTPT